MQPVGQGQGALWVQTTSTTPIKLVEKFEVPNLPCVIATKADGDADTAALIDQISRSRIANLKTAIATIESGLPALRAKMGEGLAEADRIESEARTKASQARQTNTRNNLLLALAGVPPV